MRNKTYLALMGRISGQLTADKSGITFTPRDNPELSPIHISLYNLKVTLTGLNSDYLLISDRARPEISITLENHSLLIDLKEFGVSGLPSGQSRKHHRRTVLIGVLLVCAVATFFVVPLSLVTIPEGWVTRVFSREREKKMGDFLVQHLEFKSVGKAEELSRLMNQLVDVLKVAHPALQPLQITVIVSKDPLVNAFALPGGVLVINTGLLEKAESTEEVLGVIAHELGHIELRHNLKMVGQQLGLGTGLMLVGVMIGVDVSSWLNLGGRLLQFTYSREMEREADERGLEFLLSARVSPLGVLDFFKRIEPVSRDEKLDKLLNVMSTHPMSEERVQMIRDFVSTHQVEWIKPLIKVEDIRMALNKVVLF